MHDDEDVIEHTPIGRLLRAHRKRLKLTPYALSGRTTTLDSGYIKKVESGATRRITRRSVALSLAKALELDALDTDKFLYTAGHAPVLDWQEVARSIYMAVNTRKSWQEITEWFYSQSEDKSDAPTSGTPATE